MPDRSVHMVVRGRVQGVGFRFFTREHASRCGLAGWVKNLDDGAVEIYAEGDEIVLDDFVERIEHGPRFGHVADVEKEYGEVSGDYSDFTIEF